MNVAAADIERRGDILRVYKRTLVGFRFSG